MLFTNILGLGMVHQTPLDASPHRRPGRPSGGQGDTQCGANWNASKCGDACSLAGKLNQFRILTCGAPHFQSTTLSNVSPLRDLQVANLERRRSGVFLFGGGCLGPWQTVQLAPRVTFRCRGCCDVSVDSVSLGQINTNGWHKDNRIQENAGAVS